MGAKLRVFDTAEALGAYAAEHILARWEEADAARGVMTLGCPGGRSPRSTYDALAERVGARGIDGGRVHLLMMDDYIERRQGMWRACAADAHYSCARFGELHIRKPLNAHLKQPISQESLYTPDAADPVRYERMIAALGGIDVFLLASGASDGHVAFNPPGTALYERTRRIELALTTRADNIATFPDFRGVEDVPRFGVSVGPGTIVTHARSALMILIGAHKGPALRRILDANAYDTDWPASVVHECRGAEVLADSAAARAGGV